MSKFRGKEYVYNVNGKVIYIKDFRGEFHFKYLNNKLIWQKFPNGHTHKYKYDQEEIVDTKYYNPKGDLICQKLLNGNSYKYIEDKIFINEKMFCVLPLNN